MNQFKFLSEIKEDDAVWFLPGGGSIRIEIMNTRTIREMICWFEEHNPPNPYFGRTSNEWVRLFIKELIDRNEEI